MIRCSCHGRCTQLTLDQSTTYNSNKYIMKFAWDLAPPSCDAHLRQYLYFDTSKASKLSKQI